MLTIGESKQTISGATERDERPPLLTPNRSQWRESDRRLRPVYTAPPLGSVEQVFPSSQGEGEPRGLRRWGRQLATTDLHSQQRGCASSERAVGRPPFRSAVAVSLMRAEATGDAPGGAIRSVAERGTPFPGQCCALLRTQRPKGRRGIEHRKTSACGWAPQRKRVIWFVGARLCG